MASSLLIFFSFSLLLFQPLPSIATTLSITNPYRSNLDFDSESSLTLDSSRPSIDTPPTTFFEVTKPIQLPKTKPCSTLVLQHDFGYTYGKSPVLAKYNPPSDCQSTNFDKIVLEWHAACKGRQFDRIFGVWLGGVELLRSCTAEPKATGIVWTVKKDITRYYSLLMMKNQTLAVYLGNLIDNTYTGVYHVNVSIHFYPAEVKYGSVNKPIFDDLGSGYDSWADLVLPISRNLPLKDGLWFEIENSTDVQGKQFKIPQNAYRAVLEVYVSFHENDEFWPTNFPNDYISLNNLTGYPGNGPFREVVVSLDGTIVGAVWPFTVVFTGGVNPLLWRPISGIGSFDLPSYDIDVTPLLGTLLDGKTHEFSFSVTNALNVWYVDANLHIWLDGKSVKTQGKLLSQKISPLRVSLLSNFTGSNGTFVTSVSRSIQSDGWVESSHGKIITKSIQKFNYSNTMMMGKNGDLQVVNQLIDYNDTVFMKKPSSASHAKKSYKRFPFYLYGDNVDLGNGSYKSLANITLGFIEKRTESSDSESYVSSLKNLQHAQGLMVVKKNLVVSGLGSTQQKYKYDDDKFCYLRDIRSSNYTILYDKESNTCSKKGRTHSDLGLSKRWPFPARRAFLAFASPGNKK